jgi:hypothetical protein
MTTPSTTPSSPTQSYLDTTEPDSNVPFSITIGTTIPIHPPFPQVPQVHVSLETQIETLLSPEAEKSAEVPKQLSQDPSNEFMNTQEKNHYDHSATSLKS